MQLLGMVYMTSGCILAIFVLRILHGQWNEFKEMAIAATALNGLTAILAFFLFQKSARNVIGHRIILVVCYLVGIAGGCYFYFT